MKAPFDFDWSPRGDAIAFSRKLYRDAKISELVVRDLASGEERQLTNDSSVVVGIAWLPNDLIVYGSDRSGEYNLWVIRATGGDAEQLTKEGSRTLLPPSSTADCQQLLAVTEVVKPKVYIGKFDGKNAEELESGREVTVAKPMHSPDGKRVAFVAEEIRRKQRGRR